MPEISKLPRAENDLLGIWLFIAEDSIKHADRFLSKIEKKCQALAAQPYMGQSREELAPGLRSFPVGDYVIFYRPTKRGIVIVRVLNAAMDTRSKSF
ncbi:MAG: type II toxin-antitoxin system RelE/ParE family toxin [Nitrospinales bacterium]